LIEDFTFVLQTTKLIYKLKIINYGKQKGIVLTVLLLIPLIAMQFTNEVNWTLFDFGAFLGTGFICELVIRKVKNQSSNPSLWSYSAPNLD
jgi:hypothetical protein